MYQILYSESISFTLENNVRNNWGNPRETPSTPDEIPTVDDDNLDDNVPTWTLDLDFSNMGKLKDVDWIGADWDPYEDNTITPGQTQLADISGGVTYSVPGKQTSTPMKNVIDASWVDSVSLENHVTMGGLGEYLVSPVVAAGVVAQTVVPKIPYWALDPLFEWKEKQDRQTAV